MVQFVHHKIQTLDGMLESFNKVQTHLLERTFYFESEMTIFLKSLLTYFSAISDVSKESENLKYLNLLQTAKKGFDPIKLEKISVGRRDFYWGISYHVADEIQKMLVEMLLVEKHKLKEPDDIIANTLLGLVQNKIVGIHDLKILNSVTKIEPFWQKLVQQNPSIALLEMKMKLHITIEDIYLLIEQNCIKIRQ